MDSELVRKDAKRAYKAQNYREAAEIYAGLIATPSDEAPEVLASDRTGYASALTSLNLLDEAAVQLEAAIGLVPNDARSHLKLGEILSRLGRHGDAADHLEAATRLGQADADTYWRLAMEFRTLGRDDECKAAIDKCLEINPDHTEGQLLQMESVLSQNPERDGQFEEFNLIVSGHSGQLTPLARSVRQSPLMIFLEGLGLLLASLWVRSLFV